MKKLLSLTALLAVSLVLSLALAGLTAGGWHTTGMRFHPDLAVPMVPISSVDSSAGSVAPRTARARCDGGDWRACIELAELDPSDRGLLLKRAEWLLERSCRAQQPPLPNIEPTPAIWACGELANRQMDRSPRLATGAREWLSHAVDDCDGLSANCDLAASLPPELLRRAEWATWCEKGDELACRIERAAAWVDAT